MPSPTPHALARLAETHALTPARTELAAERACRSLPGDVVVELARACRTLCAQPLHGLASVRESTAGLDELVLPEAPMRALRAMIATVRQRALVHDEWGYGERRRGLAVTALFSGPSGTGKTTAAEAVARELGRDLVAVDLSQVVSKYIGETEKNLAALFEAAESGAVLVFDEGDALFGRRTAVRDSHDRYANLEVSYLLQRLETFNGIAIVTTNAREAIDAAFVRRMRFVVTFPFPDAAQRAELWRAAFPAGVPTEGLSPARLAQLAVSGGTITQLALHASFLAADEGAPGRDAARARRRPHRVRQARPSARRERGQGLGVTTTEETPAGWTTVASPYDVTYAGQTRRVTEEQWSPDDPAVARINLGEFLVPQRKGPWADHYNRLAANRALQATIQVNRGRIRPTCGSSAPPPPSCGGCG